VLSTSGEIVDSDRQPVGVRTVEVRDRQFLINGNPFYFMDFGKHEDAAVHGKGHDDVLMVHDFALLDWIGANSFRTAHYPFAAEMLDYADRHGMVVIGETAAVGLNLNIGGGVFASSGRVATFSPDKVNDDTQRTHLQAIRELVARDKNRPAWCCGRWPTNRRRTVRSARLPRPARRGSPSARPDPASRLRQRTARATGAIPDHRPVRLRPAQPLLRLALRHRRSRIGRDRAGAELRQWADLHNKPIITEYGASRSSMQRRDFTAPGPGRRRTPGPAHSRLSGSGSPRCRSGQLSPCR
jgi:beta-glucuronidase